MKERSTEPHHFPFFFYVIVAAAITLILIWGNAEKGPTRWDDSWYLAAAVRLFDRFAEEGFAGYWRGFEHALGDKAPLITVLPFPFFCLIGRSTFVIYLVNSAACVLLSAALYRFCRRFFCNRVALLAVFFALTSPVLLGLSRLFLVEYWLTALVVASIWALSEWEHSERPRWLLGLGALCGLGLLMKITFPIFVGPVVAWILWRKHGKNAGRLLLDIVLIAVPALLLAGPWYGHNWESVTHRSFRETYFVPTHPIERQSPLSMAVDYAFVILNQGFTAVHVAAIAAGLLLWVLRRRDNLLGDARGYILPWIIALPIFALSDNRELRLASPMVPAWALVTAVFLNELLSHRRAGARRLIMAAAFAGCVLITLGNSFALFGPRQWRLGYWQIFAHESDYAFPPNPQRWPLAEVLDFLANRERLGPGSKLIVGMGADTWSFNTNNLELYAALLRYPIEFHTTAYTSNRALVERIMSGTQYFLIKDGGTQQPRGRFEGGPMTLEFLTKRPLFREVSPGIKAPDGGRIRIFENASAGPDAFYPARQAAVAPDLPKVDLNFGNYVQVTGLRASQQDGVFSLALRWRSLNAAPRPYRCFVHVMDPKGTMLGAMDHEILHGSPRIDRWQPGDEGYEARYVALPAGSARDAHLRFGIFDPDTGLRVPAWTSTFPLKDDYTAAVVEPNQPPPDSYAFRMAPAAEVACNVEFESGLRLTGYSIRRADNVAWLRLHWVAPENLKSQIRFFGHPVASQSPDAAILGSFDHDLGVDKLPRPRFGGALEIVQDIVRDVSKLSPEAKLLRAGVFDLDKPLDRLAVRSSSLPMSAQQKAIFLPLP